ncbi:hypothetical protein FHR24_002656 [Wenyingzhuangia heitensis]|uniref:Dolichyl-phosphate-mannose-protein mannosyltransferase n=1 Tax=Wenyingzhuangia heitensis TaxID=1487859 RepID=A0ABX0UBR9_9FLAO|nr:hypothetical protein [Wenyingzhuangia heitensis]NIJ46178.1 hypothetical protein [Wenyingzhuangia heitensis]
MYKYYFIIVISLSVFYYSFQMTTPPNGRHVSGMTDYYAVSLNFIRNDFSNFFTPETYCLNPQFGPKKNTSLSYWSYTDHKLIGITALDFPINEFNVAILMKVFNTYSPFIYRFYTLLISLIGLFFLFKTALKLTQSILIASATILFCFTVPSYAFYANSFLASPVALSLFFISNYYLSLYYNTKNIQSFFLSILFLTLSSLMRFTFLIFLISYTSTTIIYAIYTRKVYLKELVIVFLAILIVLCYFTYNKYLGYNYGSIFLSSPNYPKNFTQLKTIFLRIITHKSWYYGTLIHFVIFVKALLFIIKHKKGLFIKIKNNYLLTHIVISLLGCSLFFIIGMTQFAYHDYYILDTFFPVILYFLLILASKNKSILEPLIKKKIISYGFAAVVLCFAINYADTSLRKNKTYTINQQIFYNSYLTLDSLHISKNAKILMLGSSGSNLPLAFTHRKGYSILKDKYINIKPNVYKNWEYDYIITKNTDTLPNLFINKNKLIYSNKNYSIYK